MTLNMRALGKSVANACAYSPFGSRIKNLALGAVLLSLSARAYHRVLKIGRTIADLAGAEELSTIHVSEAIQYRSLDRRKAA